MSEEPAVSAPAQSDPKEHKKRKHKKKDKHGRRDSVKENSEQEEDGLAPLRPIKLGKSGHMDRKHRSNSPSKRMSPDPKGLFMPGAIGGGHLGTIGRSSDKLLGGGMLGMESKSIMENLPKVERRAFDVEAKLFQQTRKEFEQARTKRGLQFDPSQHTRHNSINPLSRKGGLDLTPLPSDKAALPSLGNPKSSVEEPSGNNRSTSRLGLPAQPLNMEMLKLGAKKRMVLPNIADQMEVDSSATEALQVESGDGAPQVEVKTIEEVKAMLPEEFSQLREMMDLHRDLKSQMSQNKEQLASLGEQDNEMTNLLRQQSSHVVNMMKNVLDQMESYPEELWALYGAMEAYEKCFSNMDKVKNGEEISPVEGGGLGPTTVEEHQEALIDIYRHILESVQGFLALPAHKKGMSPNKK